VTLGSAITTGVMQASLWRISSAGPGVPAAGSAPGSITGGAIAIAAGAASTCAASRETAPKALAAALAPISGT
jgi:hypothetical protein